jgi:hypothetical protein
MSGYPQSIPQYIEAPPNMEVQLIVSIFFTDRPLSIKPYDIRTDFKLLLLAWRLVNYLQKALGQL